MSLSGMSHVRPTLVFFFIGIIFLCYSNTFEASWHLDDEPNITHNSKLHLSSLTLQQIKNTFRALPSPPNNDRLYRPLACLSFALNWYVGQDNVFGYHLVNILIHILTACFLFLTLHLLLHIHYKKQYPPQFFTAAALLAALFWALAPIQTQAVTYIVQRMASMAAMFTIIAIYTYLRGRTERKKIWFILCLLSFLAALGSKENAILLPASLLLIELSFFPHHFSKKHIGFFIFTGGTALICVFLITRYGFAISLFSLSNPLSFLDGYDDRSFSFSERILTQPRIALIYLTQIFFPIIERLSIEHDITLSTSLSAPWTTLPAMLVIFLLNVVSFSFLKKFPLICFPVLFFFLNHIVESTILPLEFIFEHRNYLPSFFLFLPPSIFVAHALYGSGKISSFGRGAVIFCATLFLIISGQATYTRNLVWTTEGTLWNDTLRKAPNSPRAAHNLARWYYRQLGRYQQAYHYFQRSLKNAETAADPKRTKKSSLNALGSVAYLLGDHELAQRHYSQCLNLDKKDEICLKNSVLAYLRSGLPKKALIQAKKLSGEHPVPFDTQFEYQLEYQYLTALAAYQSRDQGIALIQIQKIASRSVGNHQNMYLAGCIMMKEQVYPNALFFLKRANKLSPNTAEYQLALAEAYHASKLSAQAEKTIQKLLNRYPLPVIIKMLNKAKRNVLDDNSAEFVEYALSLLPHKL